VALAGGAKVPKVSKVEKKERADSIRDYSTT
jgi:hypothetical protein